MIRSLFYFMLPLSLLSAFITGCTPRIAGGYEVKGREVIYHSGMKGLGSTSGKPVKGADTKTFVSINRYFGKDKNRAYYLGAVVENSHGPTFEVIEGPYQRDKNRVYHLAKVISKRPANFKILFIVSGRNKDTIFATDGKKIFRGESEFFPDLVDVATFERIGESRHFKDKNRVYSMTREIKGADPATFEASTRFNGRYTKDKDHLFFDGRRVKGADLATHKIIDEHHHQDKDHVFFNTSVLSKDPNGFKILNRAYSKDSETVYWRHKKISDDAKNFVTFPIDQGLGAYAKDSTTAFWGSRKIEGADVETFEGLNQNYAKDKNRVYFAVNTINPPRVLKGADPETFALVKGDKRIDARDKNNEYYFGNRKKPNN